MEMQRSHPDGPHTVVGQMGSQTAIAIGHPEKGRI